MTWQPRETVVVPIDFSDSSLPTILTALDMAERPDGVRVIHVLRPLDFLSAESFSDFVNDESRLQHAQAMLEGFLESHGVHGVTAAILSGDPGRQIVRYAKDSHADLIVSPSHGYHGYRRILLGSTTERVIRHAHCPVYVTRRGDAE